MTLLSTACRRKTKHASGVILMTCQPLLKCDLVHVTAYTDAELIKNIEKDGVVLYEKD